ncbi:MAG TPA: hypothetical protein VFI33_20265 [Puia sp.]|nr:hypothetical protein [Puia sp.]
MSRYYKASSSGLIYYNLTLLAWLTLVLSFCLEIGMNYHLASGKISSSALTGLALVWTVGAGIISYFILKIFNIKMYLDSSEIPFVYFSIFYITGNLLISFFSALFYALKNFIAPNLILITCNIILICLMPKKSNESLAQDHFIYIYYTSFLFQGVLIFLLFIMKNLPGLKIRLPGKVDMMLLLGMSVWAFLTNGLAMVLYRLDYWFVDHYCSTRDLGNYIQASKIGQAFLVIPSIISTAVFPMMASGMLKSPVKNIQSLTRSLVFFSSIPAIILVFTGKWLFPYILGNSFELMYIPFVLLIPGLLAFCLICPITAYYGGKKILYVNFVSLLTAVMVVIILDALTVPEYGIKAAAIVSSLGYLCYAGCLIWFFNKQHSIRIANFFTIRYSDFGWVKKLISKADNLL